MSFSFDKITTGVTDFVKGAADKIGNVLDPSQARLSVAGLLQGGRKKDQKTPETRVGFSFGNPNGVPVPIEKDWRVRVSLGKSSGIFYLGNPGILKPLVNTQGVVFPYTPEITTTYSASYSQQRSTHSNYPAYFYDSSEVQAIQISGDFTVQTEQEGQYLLASIYFFRSCTKMFYGQGPNAGNPPPIVFLNGYGSHLFPNVPCLLTSFQHVMSSDVDYIEVSTPIKDPLYEDNSGGPPVSETVSAGKGPTTRVPTTSKIQISLQPVYSRKKVADFDLEKFARGDLIDKGFL